LASLFLRLKFPAVFLFAHNTKYNTTSTFPSNLTRWSKERDRYSFCRMARRSKYRSTRRRKSKRPATKKSV